LFKDKLTAEHIKTFADTVQAVRAPFWQEGGISKERRKEAVATLKEVFTGAGLEVLLIDMGLNPATIAFNKTHGLIGKVGRFGQQENIQKEQNDFWAALQERLPKYVEAGEISQERADWVVAGIAAMKHGEKPPPPPEQENFKELEITNIKEAIDNSDILVHHHKPRNDKFSVNANTSLGAKFIKEPIRKLIDDAEKIGDWREAVLHQRQNMDTQIMVE
jgi:hypothetical protein